jgi:uncharacterized protein
MSNPRPRPIAVDELPVAGEIGPLPDLLDAPFWDGLAVGVLRVQRCDHCATWVWSPQWICPQCHSFDLTWTETPARGTVYTWTRTWQRFNPEFDGVGPYTTVLVELPEAGNVRILGLLADAVDADIGDEVVGVIQQRSELTTGQPVLRWRLADSSGQGD